MHGDHLPYKSSEQKSPDYQGFVIAHYGLRIAGHEHLNSLNSIVHTFEVVLPCIVDAFILSGL